MINVVAPSLEHQDDPELLGPVASTGKVLFPCSKNWRWINQIINGQCLGGAIRPPMTAVVPEASLLVGY